MPKRPNCLMPACGIDGRLCPDCANYTFPGAGYKSETEAEEGGRLITYDYLIRVMEGARCVREIPGQITVLTPSIDDMVRAVFKHAPTIKSPPPPDGVERIWGFPIVENPAIPAGTALVGTPCLCHLWEVKADGGGLLHMAKRHCLVIKFGDDANEDKGPESSAAPPSA